MPATALEPEQRLSWFVALLPYMEQDNLFKQIDVRKGWNDVQNEKAVRSVVATLAWRGWASGRRSIQRIMWLRADHVAAGFFGYDRRITLEDIKDGASCTIVALEGGAANPWAAGGPGTDRGFDPDDLPYIGLDRPFGLKHRQDSLFRAHPVSTHVVFADGACRSITDSLDPSTFRALATIAGGEEIGSDFWQ